MFQLENGTKGAKLRNGHRPSSGLLTLANFSVHVYLFHPQANTLHGVN